MISEDKIETWNGEEFGTISPPPFKMEFREFKISKNKQRLFIIYEIVHTEESKIVPAEPSAGDGHGGGRS